MARKKTARKRTSTKRSTKSSKRHTNLSLHSSPFMAPEGHASRQLLGEPTGRKIGFMVEEGAGAIRQALSSVRQLTGLTKAASSSDFKGAMTPEDVTDAEIVVLEEIGAIIFEGAPDQMLGFSTTASVSQGGMFVEDEYWRVAEVMTSQYEQAVEPSVAAGAQPKNADYWRGYRDAIDSFLGQQPGISGAAGIATPQFQDDASTTWGLKATGVDVSPLSGSGVKIAVIDSGFDISHPDFVNRGVVRTSTVPSSFQGITIADHTPDDVSGHGTHCVGTAAGPRVSTIGRRYGVASEAEIFTAKALAVIPQIDPNNAVGADSWIIMAMNEAVRNGAQIISMSLGGQNVASATLTTYEAIARRALSIGIIIIAAAGNESDRNSGVIRFVGDPAGRETIGAVAAVDNSLQIANFSNRGTGSGGQVIDIAGPGVDVFSSFPTPAMSARLSGTSMATPHVSGIAALICQETGKIGADLINEIRSRTVALPSLSPLDVGAGLVHV